MAYVWILENVWSQDLDLKLQFSFYSNNACLISVISQVIFI